MEQYVLGFIFDSTLDHVLLIRKNRPSFQAGKLNGIGGKIEEGESDREALTREVMEEANLHIPFPFWTKSGEITGKDFSVKVFWCLTDNIDNYRSMTDEVVSKFSIHDNWWGETMDNVNDIISMILEEYR